MPKDTYNRAWITENAIDVISRYRPGELTLRALHYQLVGLGMTNTTQHYKRVVAAMEVARWDGRVPFETFSDLDRGMVSETDYRETDLDQMIDEAKGSIQFWTQYYRKNRWENQPYYPEVFIEKKALQGIFKGVCDDHEVALGACKGYPSLTFLHEAAVRFKEAERAGKTPIILYFGDYDPSGEDIPRSVGENLGRMGVDLEVRRFALFEHQVREWKLPPAPAKITDSRTANWDGLGQVELDAVKPEQLKLMARDAIRSVFDEALHEELKATEDVERVQFRKELKQYVNDL